MTDKFTMLLTFTRGILRTGTHHSGVTGFIIQLIKNDVNTTLQVTTASIPLQSSYITTQNEHINTDTPFIAPQLSTLTKLVFTLPKGEQTDLLKESDQSVKHSVCVLLVYHLSTA